MKIETCEQYVLNELENTRNELFLVKKELEEKDKYIDKTYYRLFNKTLGYITNVDFDCSNDGVFSIGKISYGSKEDAMLIEVINNNHVDINNFISKLVEHNSYLLGDEHKLIFKEEVDNIFIGANQLNSLINLLK